VGALLWRRFQSRAISLSFTRFITACSASRGGSAGNVSGVLPSVKSIFEALLIFNLPFTFVKGLISVAVSMLIYKPLSPLLKGKNV
jgi:riboflavin transporter FmnP